MGSYFDTEPLFTNREIAVAFWAVAFSAYALSLQTVRESLVGLLKLATKWKILVPFILLVAYVIAIVWSLQNIGFWNPTFLKETVIWFAFSGLALAFSFVPRNLEEGVLKRILLDNIRIIVLLEFIVQEYNFSLPVELVVVPFIAIVAALDVIAKADQQYAKVAKFTTGLQVIFGLLVLSFAIVQAFNDFHQFASIDTFKRITLIPILSISLTPYIYVLLILTNYELLFLRLTMNSQLEPEVARYAKWRLLRHLRLRPKKIRQFIQAHALELMRIRSRADLDNLVMRGQ